MGGILTMDLSTLVKMSNTYGSNPAYVLAGGGNTSVKDDTTLYVKGSGTQLATIKAEEFVEMSRARLNEIMKTDYPEDDKSRIKYKKAENILGALGEAGFREIGVKERPGLVVLRRTRMPALLIETGFINSDEDNKLFDEKFNEIAQGIADAILGTLDEETVQEPLYYRVQTGVFRKRENADRMLYQLLEKGYPSFILHEDGFYKVQTGAYQQIGNAVNMEQRLRDDGYSTITVTK